MLYNRVSNPTPRSLRIVSFSANFWTWTSILLEFLLYSILLLDLEYGVHTYTQVATNFLVINGEYNTT